MVLGGNLMQNRIGALEAAATFNRTPLNTNWYQLHGQDRWLRPMNISNMLKKYPPTLRITIANRDLKIRRWMSHAKLEANCTFGYDVTIWMMPYH